MIRMIIKVGVKVAGDDEFMRCGSSERKEGFEFMRCVSSKRKERIKYITRNRKKVRRSWKMKEDDRY